jgi:putative FmdB family regulatory protein
MPTYDYTCKACGHTLEVYHAMAERGPKKCPKCGKLQLAKAIGLPAFHTRYSPMHPRVNRGRGH